MHSPFVTYIKAHIKTRTEYRGKQSDPPHLNHSKLVDRARPMWDPTCWLNAYTWRGFNFWGRHMPRKCLNGSEAICEPVQWPIPTELMRYSSSFNLEVVAQVVQADACYNWIQLDPQPLGRWSTRSTTQYTCPCPVVIVCSKHATMFKSLRGILV
jgi:hypothetical protein